MVGDLHADEHASFALWDRIGRNYAAHAKELNNAVPTEPFFFLKPTTSYIANNGTVEIPKGIVAHYEVELGVVIGSARVRDVSAAEAMQHVAGYTLSIDMTARNLQDKVKSKGLPWSSAKGFDTSRPRRASSTSRACAIQASSSCGSR